MRILTTTHGYPPELAAGTERVVERLARELKHRGHEVFIVSGTFEPKPRVEVVRRVQDGIPIYTIHRDDLYFDRWEKTYHPGVSEAFDHLLGEIRPDIVHIQHFIRLSRDLAHRAAMKGIPSVITLHDFVTTCLIGFRAPDAGSRFCNILPEYEACVSCAGTVHPNVPTAPRGVFDLLRHDMLRELCTARVRCAISRTQRELLENYHQLPAGFVREVPLAPVVELPHGTPAPEPPQLCIATWGMQMERKSAHVLIEACRRLGDLVKLHIFGKFDNIQYENRCRELARGLPVLFHGRYEWDELLATPLHASVFPSMTFETFGLTFDESWAMGHPVIATDLGAYRERANKSVVLFPPGDSERLAEILLSFVKNPGSLMNLRKSVTPPRRFQQYAGEMEAIFGEAISAGAPQPTPDGSGNIQRPDVRAYYEGEAEFRKKLAAPSS